jgi:hypothetical protein
MSTSPIELAVCLIPVLIIIVIVIIVKNANRRKHTIASDSSTTDTSTTDTDTTQTYYFATLDERILNEIIDSVIISTVYVMLSSIMDYNLSPFLPLFLFVYYVGFETLLQRTPAKYITKTEVVMVNDSKPNFGAIVLRTICRLVPFNAFSVIGTPKDERTWWHDRWSSTRVIQT